MLDRPQPPPATCRDDESNTLEKQPFQTASMVKLFMRSIDIISTKLDAMSHVYCASQRHRVSNTANSGSPRELYSYSNSPENPCKANRAELRSRHGARSRFDGPSLGVLIGGVNSSQFVSNGSNRSTDLLFGMHTGNKET